MTAIIIFFLSLVAIAAFLILPSIVTIKPNETGLLIRFGVIEDILDAGIHFCFWLTSKVDRYEKTPLVFRFKLPSAMTKNGIVKGYKEDGAEIERTEIEVQFTLTTYFDRANLIKTAINAPGNTVSSLGPVIELYVLGVFRSIASEIPWPLFDGERIKVADYALSKIIPDHPYFPVECKPDAKNKYNVYRFTGNEPGDVQKFGDNATDMGRYNPLVQFGLDLARTTVEIQDVNFSDPRLREAFNSGEGARLKGVADMIADEVAAKKIRETGAANAQASKDQGIADAHNLKVKGEANAEARKLMIAQIKDNPELEYLRALEEMAKGTSNTVVYEFPKVFSEKLSSVLGGSKSEDFSGLLKDPKVVAAIKEAIESLTTK